MAKAKRVALDLGTIGGKAIEMLMDAPLTAGEIVESLFEEARNEAPDGAEFAFLAGELDKLRLDAAGGDADARAALRDLEKMAEAEIDAGGFQPGALLYVGHAFAAAGLEAPQALKAALEAELDAHAAEPGEADIAAMHAALAEMAAGLDHDPFAIHEHLSQMVAAVTGEKRAAATAALISSNEPSMRDAAIGFLLDRDETTVGYAAALIAEGTKDSVSSVTVERLVRMRPWVSGPRRAAIDELIRVLRPKAEAPAARAAPAVDVRIATFVDGSGAQSLFSRAKCGKRFLVASLLIKEGAGVADAWVRADLTRKEADEMLAQIRDHVPCAEVSHGFCERRLRDALVTNFAHAPPPFALVQVAEVLGLGPLPPEPVDIRALAEEMLAGLPPSQTDADACEAAARGCRDWDERFDIVDTWFEANDETEALLGKLKTRKAQLKTLCEEYLPKRRGVWAARLAWTAAAARESQSDMLLPDWGDMALMARALADEDPKGGASVLEVIAQRTVDVFAAQE